MAPDSNTSMASGFGFFGGAGGSAAVAPDVSDILAKAQKEKLEKLQRRLNGSSTLQINLKSKKDKGELLPSISQEYSYHLVHE